MRPRSVQSTSVLGRCVPTWNRPHATDPAAPVVRTRRWSRPPFHERTHRRPGGPAQATPPVVLAVGHVPDRRRLLLDPRLPALHRLRERGPPRPTGDHHPRPGHALRGTADLLVRVWPLAHRA